MADRFAHAAAELHSPLIGAVTITPNDGADLPLRTRQIRVTGSSGTIRVRWADGNESTEPVTAGETLDWRIDRVFATGTTATGLRGYY